MFTYKNQLTMLAWMLHLTYLDGTKTQKLILSFFFSFYFWFKFNLFFNLKQCPECFGDDLCSLFQTGQIQLTCFDYLLSVVNPNLTKSVYHGVLNETRVVIKRKTQKFGLGDGKVENVILCPSVQGVQFLYTDLKGELWSNLNISIEPLLLKYFASRPEWLFTKYIGACGDLIVEEYKGKPLSTLIESDFKTRASLAIELLKMAHLFTFGHPDYAFYFTDYSLDNLVADSSGKVFLIDLDHVIISASFKVAHFPQSIHKSEILDDRNYAFSPTDICSHYLSDHNFFSVCKYLLSNPENGLLRIIPESIKEKPQLSFLLNECTNPKAIPDRFSAGSQLQSLLAKITKGC